MNGRKYIKKYSSREEKIEAMINGELEPRDKNFFEMTLGKEVVVECRDGNIIKGKIRTPFDYNATPGYVVEKEDGDILTTLEFHARPHNPPHSFGYKAGIPMIFGVDKPNHQYIFESTSEKDFSKIDDLKNMAKKFNCTPFQLVDLIDSLSEKYPHKFI